MTKENIVYMKGQWLPMSQALVPVNNHTFLYGTSVFEGIRAYYNKEENQLYAFRVKEHMERLLRSARIMTMNTKLSADDLVALTKEILKKNDYHEDVYIRPEIYKDGAHISPDTSHLPDDVLIFTQPLGDYLDTAKGLSVCVSNWRRSDDNAIPPRAKVSGCYANTALIVADAKRAGFDDAIVLSPTGEVTEGSAMNLFLVQNGKLVTSKTTDNILVGVTRNTVIEIAANELGLETVERTIDRTELYISDEAFYCGTGVQISPITAIDNRPVGNGHVGEITEKIKNIYFDVVKGKNKKYNKWCLPVYD